jgi:hypothetical protein
VVTQPLPLPQPVQPLPPPKTVVVHVDTFPPGAEVRQGDRVFGAAPRDLLLPRTNVTTHLTFHLDGYEAAAADVVPLTDDAIRVKLTPHPKRTHARPLRPVVEKPKDPKEKKHSETLPNPY